MRGTSVPRRALGLSAAALVASVGALLPRPVATAAACAIDGVERVVAIGDVHGANHRLTEILQAAGLVDKRLRWTGGRAHLVQLGDVVDRGSDSRQALDLLRRLSEEAPRSGGAVHMLLGNHEVMRMVGDLRYTVPGEYKDFANGNSERLRAAVGDQLPKKERDAFLKDTPLGLIEMRVEFGRDGTYGRWLRTLDSVVIINGVLFVHGGISPAVAGRSCEIINDTIRREIGVDEEKTRTDPMHTLSAGEDGPLWYRGEAQEPDTFEPEYAAILAREGVRAMVIGHTIVPRGRIRVRFGDRLFQIDTGMNPDYVADGRASALEIRNDIVTAIYTDRATMVGTLPAARPQPSH